MKVTHLILAFGLLVVFLAGCASHPTYRQASRIEKALTDYDTVYVFPTVVDYARRGFVFSKRDSALNQRIGTEADRILCEAIRSDLSKEVILVEDKVAQADLLARDSLLHFQLVVDAHSYTWPRRLVGEALYFTAMIPLIPLTLGYSMKWGFTTTSDVTLWLTQKGEKEGDIFRQKSQDDLDPAIVSDLQWQVRKTINPRYQGS